MKGKAIDSISQIFEEYLPQILAGLWVFVFIAVIQLSYLALKVKKQKWTLSTERFKNFKYYPSGGWKKEDLIQKIRLDHYEDYHKAFKGLYIAHVYEESRRSGKKFDIYIYIAGDNSKFIDEIERADFMLGPAWNNHILPAQKVDGKFGIITSASDPFLCTCCVTLLDGRRLFMDRFIDFEMDKLII